MRSEFETNRAIDRYSDMLRRICFYHLRDSNDTEDICQNVFLKYLTYEGSFDNDEHEKAWFIRVTINACTDHLRSLFRHTMISLEELYEHAADFTDNDQEVLSAVLSLPAKYKDVIYLHYFEGYSAVEISKILNKKENTIYSLLSRGRTLLKNKLGGEEVV